MSFTQIMYSLVVVLGDAKVPWARFWWHHWWKKVRPSIVTCCKTKIISWSLRAEGRGVEEWAGRNGMVLGNRRVRQRRNPQIKTAAKLKSSPQQDESRPFQSEKPQASGSEPVPAGDLVRGVCGWRSQRSEKPNRCCRAEHERATEEVTESRAINVPGNTQMVRKAAVSCVWSIQSVVEPAWAEM